MNGSVYVSLYIINIYFSKEKREDAMTNLISPSEFLKSVLEKGRTFAEGTVRTWSGKTYKKTGGKWLP